MGVVSDRGWVLRSALWLLLFGGIALAWLAMISMAGMSGVDWAGRRVGMNMMPMESYGALAAMWLMMMAAMMLPVMVPTLAAYDTLIRSANGTRDGWLGVLGGYLGVWLAFGAGIAAVQFGLLRAGWIDGLGIAISRWLAAGLLIVVGLYQFTRLKEVCHGVCHAPTAYFLGHWRTGPLGGLRMGAGLGAYCAACCWGYMALGFVGGTMSLLWMGGATLLMILEKLPQIGHRILKPIGGAMIAAGLILPFV